jgi:hypothetical protein
MVDDEELFRLEQLQPPLQLVHIQTSPHQCLRWEVLTTVMLHIIPRSCLETFMIRENEMKIPRRVWRY